MSCTQFMVLRETDRTIYIYKEREIEGYRERDREVETEKSSKKLVNISVIQERDNANQFINNLISKISKK